MNPKWLNYENSRDALAAQREMAEKVLLKDMLPQTIKFIGGMDTSNNRFDPNRMLFGATTLLSFPSLELVQNVTQATKQTVPYIPGLLGFREAPTLIQTYQQLNVSPDIILVDGHGVSHPRGLGVASHIGVLLDMPTIGVAKSILVGTLAEPLSDEAGSMVPLIWKGCEIGKVVRTKKRCAPLIISAGHKITLTTAIEIVMRCIKKHRLPDPTRYAHLAANHCRKTFL